MKGLYTALVIIFSLTLHTTTAYCQKILPEATLSFRLYGKNANPISDTDKQYMVSAAGLQGKIPFKNGWFTTQWMAYSDLIVTITHQDSSMILSLPPIDFDSIAYSPGSYNIPYDYTPLFLASTMNKSRIVNRYISLFKVANIDSAPKFKDFTYDYLFKDYTIHSCAVMPDKKTTVLVASKQKTWFLLYGNDTNSSWKKVKLDFDLTSCTNITPLPLSDTKLYLAIDKYPMGTDFVKIDTAGKILYTDKFLDSLLNIRNIYYSVQFMDKTTGYALVPSKTSTFYSIAYKTTDGGAHWTKVNPKLTMGHPYISRMMNHNSLYVYSYDSYGNVMFYKTIDGGKTWNNVTPNEKSFDQLSDIPVAPYIENRPTQSSLYVFNKQDSKIYEVTPNINLSKIVSTRFQFAAYDKNIRAFIGGDFLFLTRDNGETWKFIHFENNLVKTVIGARFLGPNTLVIYSYSSGIFKINLGS